MDLVFLWLFWKEKTSVLQPKKYGTYEHLKFQLSWVEHEIFAITSGPDVMQPYVTKGDSLGLPVCFHQEWNPKRAQLLKILLQLKQILSFKNLWEGRQKWKWWLFPLIACPYSYWEQLFIIELPIWYVRSLCYNFTLKYGLKGIH